MKLVLAGIAISILLSIGLLMLLAMFVGPFGRNK